MVTQFIKEINRAGSVRMTDYNDITLARYMRVITRHCIALHEIGFSTVVIMDILVLAVDEAIRIVKE